jgi:hypothetical protein
MLKNKVLRRIFGPRWDQVKAEWRRLHSEELYVLYSTTNIIRVIKWTGHVACMGRGLGACWVWWGNLRNGGNLEDRGVDESIILKWICKKWDCSMHFIHLAQDRDGWLILVNAVMTCRVSKNARDFFSSGKPVSYSWRILHHGDSYVNLRVNGDYFSVQH